MHVIACLAACTCSRKMFGQQKSDRVKTLPPPSPFPCPSPSSFPFPSSHSPSFPSPPLLPLPPLPFPSRMQSSKMDLLCAAALMGAPTALDDDSVNIPETVTALHQLEKTLTSEVCDHEVDEGRSGNEQVCVTCKTLFTGKKVWVADEGGLRNIDIGPTANIPISH